MFIPDTRKYPYPEDTSGHYAPVKEVRHLSFDKDYPYVDSSKSFRFKRFWVRLLLRIIVFPFMEPFITGVKIKGKHNIKNHKELLSKGTITISNHVHPWDYICNMKAVHNFKWPYLLSIKENINGDSGQLVRLVGGIPIPENDNHAVVAFNNSITKLLKEGHFLQVYAEGSMWEYYSPIRPFKRGAFFLAIKNNVPIIPMAFSYRKPNWIRKNIFKQKALFNLNIGEPLLPNPELKGTEQVDDLITRTHDSISALAGFRKPLYSAIYNNSKRIDFNGE